MPSYTPPLRDFQFVLHELLQVTQELGGIERFAEVDVDTADAILEEGGKFAAEVLQPINLSGDSQGCTLDAQTHSVTTPDGFKQAWDQMAAGGWLSLVGEEQYGGQALPQYVNTCVMEMFNSANQAWTMYPGLTSGVYAAVLAHGSEAQKQLYLPRLLSGQWAGTMCLTEAHCGTDLGLLRTRAEPQGDGSYKITGSKIFISAGEHDLTENIVQLVLARLPDAPAGSKGISLFIVPKFRVDAEGKLGERNPVWCTGIEEKMGIHGNATCQISLDGATGYMVSQPNKGLAAMFVMMNGARLGVGNQSLGLTEVAYQNALAYAKERLQMRSLSGPKNKEGPADPIIVHPDVRKMLLTAKAYAEGGRALAAYTGLLLDKAQHHPDADVREESEELVALLTPIVKAFLTDNGLIATNACMQVFGGHGYIHENGMEQFARDARINLIYEGTNTVQALDLLGRKVLANQGQTLRKFGKLVQELVTTHMADEKMAEFIKPLGKLGQEFTQFTMDIGMAAMSDADEVGAAATDYLRAAGHLVFGYFFARMAALALQKITEGSDDPFYPAKLQTARFYFARLFPEAGLLMRTARSGAANLLDTEQALA